jgi:hypothetical protein
MLWEFPSAMRVFINAIPGLFDDDQRGISLYLDTVHSVLPARTARYFADIVTEFFKYSVQTTTKTSMFLDKHGINKPVKNFQVNIFILYIFLYR